MRERLKLDGKEKRYADYKAERENDPRQGFELWYMDGRLKPIPTRLIPTPEDYDDAAQQKCWASFTSRLVVKPPANINPILARFTHLKPLEALKTQITVYFTPSDNPFCKIDVATLKAIIAANQDKFTDWPQCKVIEFSEAQGSDLKAVSVNFFHFFVTWMNKDDYEALWKVEQVTALPLPFPAEGDVVPKAFEDLDGQLEKGNQMLDAMSISVTSEKIQAARGKPLGRKQPQAIMGISATVVSCVCL